MLDKFKSVVFARSEVIIVTATLYLTALSLIVLQSIRATNDQIIFSMQTQIAAVLLGFAVAFVLRNVDFSIWYRISSWVYLVSIMGLVFVLFFGNAVQGSNRWIDLGFASIQPSEFAKLGLLVILARQFSKARFDQPWSVIAKSLIYLIVPSVLVLLQPDLGTTIIFGLIWLSVLLMSPLPNKYLYMIGAAVVLLVIVATPQLASYQTERLESFFGTGDAEQSYNVIQSQIAIGSGGLFGQGITDGSQSRLNFLPSQHTDFIFAVVSEKLGFVGAMSVIIALFLLISTIFVVAWSSRERFISYVCFGLGVVLSLQVIINIGMNIGVAPVTGIPLPLMSFGGTHIIMEMIAIGLTLSCIKRS